MAAIVFDESMLGAVIRMTPPEGEAVEGACFGYDPETNMVLLEQHTGGIETKITLRVLNAAKHEIEVVAPAPATSSNGSAKKLQLPPHDIEAIQTRENRAIQRALDEQRYINPSVTVRAQQIFDSLRKTMPCEWREKSILVLNEISISPPYSPSSCTGKGAALNRVKKVLAGELEKLSL